ncbi:AP180 N-terminal homology (ANTH) domain [Dillenia turbinata]|uniref:AP180 N-terminal homology (ANTH) domain n=1 Tax=Dillenia turbinata TaxID=194707 RepID=A0AAN8Z2G0_9MAGN
MGSSKLRRAFGAVKDKTSIGLAKVGSSNSLSDLEVAIVKATRHEEHPADERHIREIISLTSYSRTLISACVNFISRRLNKTRNWTVALKTLMLIHRLLSEGDASYETEIFFATRSGTRILNMSDFRDTSKSNFSWDFSAFVRTYALYLDEKLEFRMQGRRGRGSAFGYDEDDDHHETNERAMVKVTPVRDVKIERIFARAQHLQQLLERLLACRPTGGAKVNRLVIVAMYPIVKESFQIYYDITEIMGILVDRFMELEVPDCVKVYEIFCRVGKQFDELDAFYNWCKVTGIARSSEYPEVEKITPKKLDVMDEFIREKSIMAQNRRAKSIDQRKEEEEEEAEEEEVVEEDMNAIKALPPPEDFAENKEAAAAEEKEEIKQEEKAIVDTKQEADLLHLGDDAVSSEEHGNRLALALFDGLPTASNFTSTPALTWKAFSEDSDWETALVESASNLSEQKATLGGGFDNLMLDGMYHQAKANAAMAGIGQNTSGSASSVAFGSAGQPAMLALPAPPTADGSATASVTEVDPFAASLGVAPPAYVQMSELEKKQKLLVEEQMMWQQYAKDGMQGQVGITRIQNGYTMGAYTHTY